MKVLIGESENLVGDIEVPGGDITNAAAWMIAAVTARHDANITIKAVRLDPDRSGIIDALQRLGARMEVQSRREVDGHPVGDIWVRSSWLRGADIGGDTPAHMVHELPLFAVAAAVAEGTTIVRLSREERAKANSDTFDAIREMLTTMQVYMETADQGILIEGEEHYHGGEFDTHGDPRMALALGIAGLISAETLSIDNAECVESLYPGFWDALPRYTGGKIIVR